MPRHQKSMDFNLTPRQGEAFAAKEQFVLFGGAKGGGKSWLLCVWVFAQAASMIGNKLFFFRKRAVDFTNTTLETWKKAIPPNAYEINPNLKKIVVKNSRSVIDYGGLDDALAVEKLNSAEYGGGAIDQAEEVEKDSFAMCRGTLRHRLPDGSKPTYQVKMSANPRQCWLKNDFILQPRKGHVFVPALAIDNPYLPEDYVDNLREAFQHRPELLRAYLEGSWDELAGADICIKGDDIRKNKTLEPRGPVTKRIVVNDTARFGDDENVIYVMAQTNELAYIEERHILMHRSTMDTAGRLAVIRNKTNATDIFVDEINVGSGVVDALTELGEPVTGLNASAKPTISSVNKKYVNLRAQMWLEAGEKFAARKCKTDGDEVLEGQLQAVTFDYKSDARIQVEAKAEIKKRLGRSPDRADAYLMGLHALDLAPLLQEFSDMSAGEDRVGHGKLIEEYANIGDYSPLVEEPV